MSCFRCWPVSALLSTGWRCRPSAASMMSSTWYFSRSSRAARLLLCLVFLKSSMVGCCLSLRRSCARLNYGEWEIFVQWMGQAAADATWEVLEFKDAYPSFQLEDELFLNLGGGGGVEDALIGRNPSDSPGRERPSRPSQRCPQPCRA
jgi:hypothetical protein